MIDMACFDTVARAETQTASVSFGSNPHPEIAEQQALVFGFISDRTANMASSGRSPYPMFVEEQFKFGIK